MAFGHVSPVLRSADRRPKSGAATTAVAFWYVAPLTRGGKFLSTVRNVSTLIGCCCGVGMLGCFPLSRAHRCRFFTEYSIVPWAR